MPISITHPVPGDGIVNSGDYHAEHIVTGLQEALDAKQASGDYATNAALTSGLAGKQAVGDYATNADLTSGLAGKQASGDYALASSVVEEWAPNFTAAGDLYIPARVAMTISQGNAKIGTGTLTYTKSTAAAPSTFGAATLPVTLEAGAWLKIAATAVTGFVATHLKRTA